MGEQRPTLVKPPKLDLNKAMIENALELTDLSIIGPDIYTNTRELWHPPGARGIYGGAMIAQTLAAAQRTVPEDFVVHSFHCYFVLAGDSSTPVLYYVERVRDGRSFCTRTVQARQRGQAIFTVTMSFTKENSGGMQTIGHAVSMSPGNAPPPGDLECSPGSNTSPFETYRMQITDGPPGESKSRRWVRARGKISEEGGHQAHLSALAYISDNAFIGTVCRAHRLWRHSFGYQDFLQMPEGKREYIEKLHEWDTGIKIEETKDNPKFNMVVSLDHTIYFHNPKAVRANEWMLAEMDTPWSGDGRGVATMRIFSKDGTLLATCFQEGVVRLQQAGNLDGSKREAVGSEREGKVETEKAKL